MQIDFRDPAVLVDPYPHYERVRRAGRVVRHASSGAWLVPGYREAMQVFRDPGTYSSSILADKELGPWFGDAATLISADPPVHTRLRRAVRGMFSHRSISARDGVIAGLVTRLCDEAGIGGSGEREIEFISEVATPLALRTTATLLGVPPTDQEEFCRQANDLVIYTGSGVSNTAGVDYAELRERAMLSWRELSAYLEDRLDHAATPTEANVLTHVVDRPPEERLSTGEVLAMCMLLILAGTDSTIKLMAMSLLVLAEHPDQRAVLAADVGLLDGAVDELIRFAGPVQLDPRLVTRDTTLAGTSLTEGEIVWVLNAAANRDPAQFAGADRFDITRSPNPHLGFGHGIHLCLGATVARLQTRLLLAELLRRTPNFRMGVTEYGSGFFVRGPISAMLLN